MSHQQMEFEPGMRQASASHTVGYEEVPHGSYTSSSLHGQKLSWQDTIMHATAGQRLTLAIVSLGMFLFLTFGLVGISVATQVPAWVAVPILFILVLFSVLAGIINIVFNRKS